jgi:1-acyl-sn-glycerol-3-phosphate acyltransferase
MVPVTGLLRGDAPMILTVFELIAMLAVLGIAFVLGRRWEVRQQEILRRDHEGDGFRIPTAHIPQH